MTDTPTARRRRAPFGVQFNALTRKNLAFQKRRWGTNLLLVAAPFFICALLWILQNVINRQLDSRSFKCGCRCLSCCDWLPTPANYSADLPPYTYQCYEAGPALPCSPYADCSAYDDNDCGYLSSTADQVGYCAVPQPPLWPALLSVPAPPAAGAAASGNVVQPLLFTGKDQELATQLMASMWSRPDTISAAVAAAALSSSAGGGASLPSSAPTTEAQFVEATAALASGLHQFGLVLGTQAGTSISLLMEPAFVAQGSEDDAPVKPSLYFSMGNCSSLSAADQAALAGIGESITNMTGFPVACASLPGTWQDTPADMISAVYCGWAAADCVVVDGVRRSADPGRTSKREFASGLYDWRDTSRSAMRVAVWVNNSDVASRAGGPPDVQRWNQPLNLASSAFLRAARGPGASASLTGVKDMPRGSSRLSLDFSSLLGPLFMMWFMQMLLPVNVYSLVHEKEENLRMMMKMQGLRDGVYFAVQYIWMVLLYCIFMGVFVLVGGGIGLKIFTMNSYSVQAVFYLIWGNLLASWSLYFSSLSRNARSAVLTSTVMIIVTGFVANLVLVQYVEHGPAVVARILQLLPSFALFRGLYELAQYAFLADRNGGPGMTWASLRDPDNGMLTVWIIMLVEWAVLPWVALYIEAVRGTGTGVRKHPFFFLGLKYRTEAGPRGAAGGGGTEANKSPRKVWAWGGRTASPHLPGKGPAFRPGAAEAGADLSRSQSGISTASSSFSSTTGALDRGAPSPGDALAHYYGSEPGAALSPQLARGVSSLSNPEALQTLAAVLAGRIGDGARRAVAEDAGAGKPPAPVAEAAAPRPAALELPIPAAEAGEQLRLDGADVAAEAARAEAAWADWRGEGRGRAPSPPPAAAGEAPAILLHHLSKVYPGAHGCDPKTAVDNLSLAIYRRECFGLLGPNGAGKTTTIRMMEGFLEPSDGEVIVGGHSIRNEMDTVYGLTGACPQHDLLWSGLTAREHLMFYGRLKNLGGEALTSAVAEGLASVNLTAVADDLAGSYSGGMKRRLSVAIALMGDPLVVYLDEPSTGLDPASRRLLWNVIKKARRDKAVVLTTHSMEEAEALCDRLGIFVGGRLSCLGDPKDLTARFGGYLSFTITTPPHQEAAAAAVVRSISPSARPVYALGGTQKFELQLQETSVDAVFATMEEIKLKGVLDVIDWGVSNATLEEVFIKLCSSSGIKLSAFT
uniref:ABC transporter domain-containing protein n=1 Tax=Auxenochlorella protothecoides TaxID=3075 RepID=A0A1D1ZSY0_AUXPR